MAPPLKADTGDRGWIAPALARGAAISSGSGRGTGLASATAVGFGLDAGAGEAAGRTLAVVEPRRSTGLAACAGEAGAAAAVWVCVSFGVNRLLRKFFVASTPRAAAVWVGCAAAVCVGCIAAACAGRAAG